MIKWKFKLVFILILCHHMCKCCGVSRLKNKLSAAVLKVLLQTKIGLWVIEMEENKWE